MNKKPAYSLIAFCLITALYIFLFFNGRQWQRDNALRHDMTSYYAYLPALFVEHDITLDKDTMRRNEFYSWSVESPKGNARILRMSMGVAYFHLPFFLIAHYTAPLAGYPANGYNKYYYFIILVGSLFWSLLGTWLLRRVLLNYFSELITAFTIILIACGTNLLYYTIYEGPMSHCYNYFLICALLYLVIRWHQTPTVKLSVLAGLVIGVIILSRPTNIMVLMLPVLYNLLQKGGAKEKIQLLKNHWGLLVLMVVVAFLPVLPQLIYWKVLSGKLLFYTYGEEGFFFNHPHIIDGLFSYRKGWLVYTPVMALGLVGVYFLYKYARSWALGITCFLPVYIYVIYSWWTWWYGGSFGSRPMIDIYGLMALPLAALLTRAFEVKWQRATITAVCAFLLYLNGFQNWQYLRTLIHWDSMTKEAYWKVFLSKKWPENYGELVKTPDYDKAIKGEDEY